MTSNLRTRHGTACFLAAGKFIGSAAATCRCSTKKTSALSPTSYAPACPSIRKWKQFRSKERSTKSQSFLSHQAGSVGVLLHRRLFLGLGLLLPLKLAHQFLDGGHHLRNKPLVGKLLRDLRHPVVAAPRTGRRDASHNVFYISVAVRKPQAGNS